MTSPAPTQPPLGTRTKPTIEVDGLTFRDLEGDGRLTPYEDWRLSSRERVADLVQRMTPEEKAGLALDVQRHSVVLLQNRDRADGAAGPCPCARG